MAFVLAACGGGGEENTPEPRQGAEEKRVRAVLLEALTTKDPDSCTQLLTQAAVEQFTLRRGRSAVRECRKEADEVGATSASVRRVDVEGTRAEAEVEPRGGSLTFKTATFGLRKEAGRWKVDRFKDGELDRPAFVKDAREELTEPPDPVPAAVVDCMLGELKQVSDARIVQMYATSDARVILVPTLLCAIRVELSQGAAPRSLVTCVVRAARRELTSGALGRELAENPNLDRLDQLGESGLFQSTFEQIGARCAADARPGSSAGGVS